MLVILAIGSASSVVALWRWFDGFCHFSDDLSLARQQLEMDWAYRIRGLDGFGILQKEGGKAWDFAPWDERWGYGVRPLRVRSAGSPKDPAMVNDLMANW